MAKDKWRVHAGVIERVLFDMGHVELVAESWKERFSKPLSGRKYTPRLESKNVAVQPVAMPTDNNPTKGIIDQIKTIISENQLLKEENKALKEQLKTSGNHSETTDKMASYKQLKYLSQLTGKDYSKAEMSSKEVSLHIDAAKGQRAEKALGMIK